MSTLSFHAEQNLEKEIRRQARSRKIPVSRYLKETIAQALSSTGKTGAEVAGFLKGAGILSPSESVLPPWTGTDRHLG
jgi:post-segregation antitoxin (ccd killing protein)